MPAARGCIDSGSLDMVPQLFNNLQSGQLARTDCVHELVYEGTSRFLNRPCNKCSISKTEQRKCCKCNLTWCLGCVPSIVEEKEERQRAQEAYHDVTEHMCGRTRATSSVANASARTKQACPAFVVLCAASRAPMCTSGPGSMGGHATIAAQSLLSRRASATHRCAVIAAWAVASTRNSTCTPRET